MNTVKNTGEFKLIEQIREILPKHNPPSVLLGLGDDTAILKHDPTKVQLYTCDMLVENRHFRLDWIDAYRLGRRAIAVNQSDIAAMGGTPLWALISLGLPDNLEVSFFTELFKGMRDQMAEFGGVIIGGNLAGGCQELIIDVTMIGEVATGKQITRSGASIGDRLFMTGSAGMGAAGLKVLQAFGCEYKSEYADLVNAFLSPAPRVAFGRRLAELEIATAMIDISDGLSGDLGHLCESSGVGAEVDAQKLPICSSLKAFARESNQSATDIALHGGDSYELLFTVPENVQHEAIARISAETGVPVSEIGRMIPASEGVNILKEGQRHPLLTDSWDHFR